MRKTPYVIAVLRQEFGEPIAATRMTARTNELGPVNVRHGVATSKFMVRLELAARATTNLTYLPQHEIMPRQGDMEHVSLPRVLRTRVNWYGYQELEGTKPDRLCGMRDSAKAEGRDHSYFMVEIDEGTETIQPGARKARSKGVFRDSVILRKFIVYAQAWQNGAHRETFGIDTFRVLFVTTNHERVMRMQECYQAHLMKGPGRVPPGLFLFTDWESIHDAGDDLFAARLSRGDGKPVAWV